MEARKNYASKGEITSLESLNKAEKIYRKFPDNEFIPFSRNVPFREVVEIIKDKDGPWKNHLYIIETRHVTTIGINNLMREASKFLEESKENYPMDVLSISAGVENDYLDLIILIRAYGKPVRIKNIFNFLGENKRHQLTEAQASKSKLIVPASSYKTYTDNDYATHKKLYQQQIEILENSTEKEPFLNSLKTYVPKKLLNIDPRTELEYDLRTKDMDIQLNMDYENFIIIFQECMTYVTSNKRELFYSSLKSESERDKFMELIEIHIEKHYIKTSRLPKEDIPALLAKLRRALFDLYIVQDLIDDPMITDVKITDPKSIRVRVKGKAYLSNVTFIDAADYFRFIDGLIVLNNVDISIPTQTFTDEQDDNYILRFSLTAPYITSTGYPIIHIRKIPRKKPMSEELIKDGMFTEVIRDYLIDCGKNSTGIVFAGPPGSGKTTALNWFLEDGYESSAEILVIQENDELFSYRKGVMFEHVVTNPSGGEKPCTLEDLGKMALVAGANVFVIGEAKGSEITSAITLSNSGCRTAITIHSQSSKDTIDKMTDLAMRGTSNITYDQAKRMIKSFQTIVYMENYQIKEISEIIGYDENKKDMIYRAIYRAPKNDD